MSGEMIGSQTQLHLALTSAPTVFTQIFGVKDIKFPEDPTADIDITSYSSPPGKMEFITGLSDGGEFDMVMNFVPGSTSDVYLRAAKGSARVTKIVFPNGAYWTCTCNVKQYNPGALPVNGVIEANIGLKVTGAATWTDPVAPVNALLPSISGVLTNGQVLTANEGSWSSATSYTYQWRKNAVNIGGATSKTYTTIAGDVGAGIDVVVTASNSAGSANATSIKTANIT